MALWWGFLWAFHGMFADFALPRNQRSHLVLNGIIATHLSPVKNGNSWDVAPRIFFGVFKPSHCGTIWLSTEGCPSPWDIGYRGSVLGIWTQPAEMLIEMWVFTGGVHQIFTIWMAPGEDPRIGWSPVICRMSPVFFHFMGDFTVLPIEYQPTTYFMGNFVGLVV